MSTAIVATVAKKKGAKVGVAGLAAVLMAGFLVIAMLFAVVGGSSGPARGSCIPPGGDGGPLPKGPPVGDLTREQSNIARLIVAKAEQHGAGVYGAEIGIAVAWVESKLRNLDHGDRDSLGVFQQRPSTGWGTPAQVRDPALAADAFFGRAAHTQNQGLLDIRGWQQMTLGHAAQAVQGSADPDGTWYQDEAAFAAKVVAWVRKSESADAETDQVDQASTRTVPVKRKSTANLRVVSSNILAPIQAQKYRSDIQKAVSKGADVIALQEANLKPDQVLRPPGYDMYRPKTNKQFKEVPVLWRADRWTAVDQGSVMTTQTRLHWGVYGVNWVTLESRRDGERLSVVSVHNIPQGYSGRRYRAYAGAMGTLTRLTRDLAQEGPVVLPGDYNVGWGRDQRYGKPGHPRAAFGAIGVTTPFEDNQLGDPGPTHDGGGTVDYVYYTTRTGLTPVAQGTYPMHSDHRGLWTDFKMKGLSGRVLPPPPDGLPKPPPEKRCPGGPRTPDDPPGGVDGDRLNRLRQRAQMVIALAQRYPGGPGCVPGFNDQGVFPCGGGWGAACTAISMMIYGKDYVGSGDGGERAFGSEVNGPQGDSWPPPPGAIVSWPYSGSGHVSIYLGDGKWVDNWPDVANQTHDRVENGATAHWLMPPASFEGTFLNGGLP